MKLVHAWAAGAKRSAAETPAATRCVAAVLQRMDLYIAVALFVDWVLQSTTGIGPAQFLLCAPAIAASDAREAGI